MEKRSPLDLRRVVSRIDLRTVVQLGVAAIMLVAAVQFYDFYNYVMGYANSGHAFRPPAGEAFLPLGAVTAFKAWLGTGVFDAIHPAGLVIFIATWLIAWLFRRALCSWLCPVGTLLQYVSRLGQRVMGHNLTLPQWADRLLRGIKYVIGAALFVLLFFQMSSAEASSFLQLPYYVISDLKMFVMWFTPKVWVVLFLGVVLTLSFLVKSFWCRYLCPYGAMLGLVGLLSPIALTKDQAACLKCGRCNKACPGGVSIKEKRQLILTPECTGCTSCVKTCPKHALQFKIFGLVPMSPLAFGLGVLLVFFGTVAVGKYSGHWTSIVPSAAYKAIYQQYQASTVAR